MKHSRILLTLSAAFAAFGAANAQESRRATVAQGDALTLRAQPSEPTFRLNHRYRSRVTPAQRAAHIENLLQAAATHHLLAETESDFRIKKPLQIFQAVPQRRTQGRTVAPAPSGSLATRSGGAQSAAPISPNASIAANVDTFDLGLFEQNLIDAVKNQSIGYAYAITRNGQLVAHGADGDARTDTDSQIDQSSQKEMIIASMSKTITAAAMLHAMNASGVSVNDSIVDYLPPGWAPGPNVEDITFRRLLTHRSQLDVPGTGLGGIPDGSSNPGVQPFSCCTQNGNTHAAIKQIVENGTAAIDNTPADDPHDYTNANYSLMRYLITHMTTEQGEIDDLAEIWPIGDVYGAIYAQYVQENVFSPAGILKLGPMPFETANTRTLLYDFNNPNDAGTVPGDWLDGVGANGWYLSAIDLARFVVHLRHTNVILDAPMRELMNDLFLGWLDPGVFAAHVDGAFGDYQGHGGDFIMTGCMINFPINVEGVVLVNSANGGFPTHICNSLKTAYDTAFN